MSAHLRLVKVVLKPYFVLDHGAHIEEIDHPAIMVPASEWREYSAVRFPKEVIEWQKRLDAGITEDRLPRDEHGNYGVPPGMKAGIGNTIIGGEDA